MGEGATIRERQEQLERDTLSEHATLAANSKGREREEPPHHIRTAFQRDRDRIAHSKAFRRLKHKTQVFIAPEGDHYRVRLTHTLEVAQIARTIARALRLNEDLTEAISLGHDLGHTPFGHLGERALEPFIGRPFRHSEQSLRVVDHLEREGAGLNLTWEVRDGIVNHTWAMPQPGTMEAQVARFADRLAYVNHDVDDAVRAGLISEDDLPERASEVLGRGHSARIETLVDDIVGSTGDGPEVRMSPRSSPRSTSSGRSCSTGCTSARRRPWSRRRRSGSSGPWSSTTSRTPRRSPRSTPRLPGSRPTGSSTTSPA